MIRLLLSLRQPTEKQRLFILLVGSYRVRYSLIFGIPSSSLNLRHRKAPVGCALILIHANTVIILYYSLS